MKPIRFGLIAMVLLALIALLGVGSMETAIGQGAGDEARQKASQLQQQGNWKDAYDAYSRLALTPENDPAQVGSDLQNAIQCLQRLGRSDEIDAFREKVIATHPKNWRMLYAAAQSYINGEHYGFIVAGEFKRGSHRGGNGRYVQAYDRDRVRALQLMQQAMDGMDAERNREDLAGFYWSLAHIVMGNRDGSEAWRLQELTDLTELPDYEEGYGYGRGGFRGAPVGADGTPLYYHTPRTWDAAANDGERWRWALDQTAEFNPRRLDEVLLKRAGFAYNQFGEQTMAQYSWMFRQGDDDTRKDETGPYALHTLTDTETIARLATGIKRFPLPDDYNFIKLYQRLAEGGSYQMQALQSLAQIYENRRQYPTAARYWQQIVNLTPEGNRKWAQERLEQIVGNWGQFEPVMTQAAGKGATVEYRFRNGRLANFTATAIKVPEVLADVKAYFKSNPKQIEWRDANIDNIGYRLVSENQAKYLGNRVAQWTVDLKPRENHFDRRITIRTPLKTAGAYLLEAKMANGNTSRVVIWVADTIIVKKPIESGMLIYLADAASGAPVAGASLDFFGYKQDWVNVDNGRGHYNITTREFKQTTDGNGQYVAKTDVERNHNWLITATAGERFAYHGFSGIWWSGYPDYAYNQTKSFVITDRPVYRPEHTVKFKAWINHAKYDLEGKSLFAGKTFTVRINNPKGEKVYEKQLTADQYGGINDELVLPKDATLGVYGIGINELPNRRSYGGSSFRVEEYKKPEFEVKVVAPQEPVMLGETVVARVQADYLFGAPVTNAKVKYKVTRSNHSANWYPVGRWDWMYEPGYWWYAYDYTWYPRWREWGCPRPIPTWWQGYRGSPQPEIVAEAEVQIGADGTVPITIDTAIAKALLGDTDHRYAITAEVTDQSRRTIVGSGSVLVARKPYKVYAWVDRGHYRVGDSIQADFSAQTLDNKPVKGEGTLRLYRVGYTPNAYGELEPKETEVQRWNLDPNAEGRAHLQMKAEKAGQYRLSYKVTDRLQHVVEGGYVFYIAGEGVNGSDFRFNDLELVTDKREYAPGEQVNLRINTNTTGGTVLLFTRAADGITVAPKTIRLQGKSINDLLTVEKKDMPNFFIEALTVSNGQVYTEVREVVVPPEQRVLNVQVTPQAAKLRPGQENTVTVKLTDTQGKPYSGQAVVSIYDKAVEYISGGSNVPEIKSFFWKWRRHHYSRIEHSAQRGSGILLKKDERGMNYIGVFGRSVADEDDGAMMEMADGYASDLSMPRSYMKAGAAREAAAAPSPSMAPPGPGGPMGVMNSAVMDRAEGGGAGSGPMADTAVRTNFADTALWVAGVTTDANGIATVKVTMPDSLTTWKTRVWAMGDGTRVGEGTTEIVTGKNIMVRLQAPRFFVQKDEVVISANVHNYLTTNKNVQVQLELAGGTLEFIDPAQAKLTTVPIKSYGETRMDWRVKVVQPGQAHIRVKALTDVESDAMQMSFPVYIHGMLKTESFSGSIRPDGNQATVNLRVPAERIPAQSRLEVRYSPSLASAMVDALPYLVDYPYGCTEQTLNRFLPTVITQKVLLQMGLNLKDIRDKRTNLNAQEIGDDATRAQDWGRVSMTEMKNPVFDEAEVAKMVQHGLGRLESMQCSDGGWGWFSGYGEQSYPHTTAVVVHGLQVARQAGVPVPPQMIARGVQWLKAEQERRVAELQAHKDWNAYAMDAYIYMVLADEKVDNTAMRDFLYRDKNDLPVYTKCMYAMALHKVGDVGKRDAVLQNIEQYLVTDDENQTAYLRLPENNWWWYWYGSEYEAQAYYLKLLSLTEPKGKTASGLAKYLINNRKHATYWNSTRDTGVVIEAMADYIKASGEDKPNMTVELKLDGKTVKTVRITPETMFSFDNKLVLTGNQVTTGNHTLTVEKQGTGPLYFNAYLTNFTLEDQITKAGLEIKVERKFYKLVRVNKTVTAEGVGGRVLTQKVEKYERQPLANLATLKSGDLVEVELEIDSKNDYEYILFEDMKAAGFEPMEVRSGYGNNGMGAYMELRDERVCFFVRSLPRGKNSISYRLRAEIPGQFSALPTKASAMYAPELKANSDEIKLKITD